MGRIAHPLVGGLILFARNGGDRMQLTALAAEVKELRPDLLLCVYVLESDNWFCRGMARGLSTPHLPVINFCETTYYGVGYDRAWLDKTNAKFKDLGAQLGVSEPRISQLHSRAMKRLRALISKQAA